MAAPTPNMLSSLDPNSARRSSTRSTQTLQAMPILHEDANASMPKLPPPTFDNLSRSSLSPSQPSSLRHSFSRNSGTVTPLPVVEWSDEEAHKKYLETVRTYHRQRPTTVYSYAVVEPNSLSGGSSSGDIALSDPKLDEQQSAQRAADAAGAVPDGSKKRDWFFMHFSWWRMLMLLLLLAAVGVGLGTGLHYGLMKT